MAYLHILVGLLVVLNVHAWLDGRDHSKEFEECFSIHQKSGKNAHFTSGVYEQYCTDLLLPLDSNNKRIGNFSDDHLLYIKQLFRKLFSEATRIGSNRVKRYASDNGDNGAGWYRTEVRTLNGKNFHRYADAVGRLKKSGEYDVIAAIHSTVVKTAHFGPNLLPWHRLYLNIMEVACGVPIPYWDSSLEYNMKDPTVSYIWTGKFFGNAIGKVTVGPFKNWPTPAGPLFRKVNAIGMLYSREALLGVLSKRRLADISTPNAKHDSNVEGHHNNVHAYVNGIMGNIALSSYDPIFFCFHSFVDALWDIFRLQQSVEGIAAEFDTVKTKLKGQSPNDPSGIKGFKNRDGYSEYTARLVGFRPWPQCSFCDGNDFVYCDQKRLVCVGKAAPKNLLPPARLGEADFLAKVSGITSGKFGDPFSPFRVDPRCRLDPVQPTVVVQPEKFY